jgi:hypothetical protein
MCLGQQQCWIDFPEQWQWQLYMTLVSAALFVLPALIISFCYTVIVATIWSKSKVLTGKKKKARLTVRGAHRGITFDHI